MHNPDKITIILPKVFRTYIYNRILSTIILLLIILFFIINLWNRMIAIYNASTTEILSLLVGTFISFLTYIMIIFVAFIYFGEENYTFLTVSKNGLEYRNLFYRLNAGWQDVQSIYSRNRSYIDPHGGEWLRLSTSQYHTTIRPLRWFIKASGLTLRIPISKFAWNWRSSELGSIIRDNVIKLHYWFIDQ